MRKIQQIACFYQISKYTDFGTFTFYGSCNIPHRRVREWWLALLRVLVANLSYAFWGVRLVSGLASPRNKTVRAVRPKADNIWQVGPGCYFWYQSRPHLLSGCADGVVGLLKGGGL